MVFTYDPKSVFLSQNVFFIISLFTEKAITYKSNPVMALLFSVALNTQCRCYKVLYDSVNVNKTATLFFL